MLLLVAWTLRWSFAWWRRWRRNSRNVWDLATLPSTTVAFFVVRHHHGSSVYDFFGCGGGGGGGGIFGMFGTLPVRSPELGNCGCGCFSFDKTSFSYTKSSFKVDYVSSSIRLIHF